MLALRDVMRLLSLAPVSFRRFSGGSLLGALLLLAGAPILSDALPGGPSGAWAAAVTLEAQVPSPADVLGFEIGEVFPTVAEVDRYMQALAAASPRVSVDHYGTTVEGRPLIQVVVASEAHRADLEGILARNRELVDPETSEARAREIAATNPAVLYFTYGVHGNESSSPSAALWTAWDLATDAAEVRGVLDSVVVVMDPVANPDGYDRYVNHWRSTRLLRANTASGTRERREPWPGGRPNHYLFDLNRDWAWLTQQESRDRAVRYNRWNPQVHVDFHEMGFQSSYFFFPAATPINPIYPEHILEWGRRFGEGNARAMDAEGLLYYTAQNFDLFYPGYGDSWPSLVGAIGMTYEQGGGSGASAQVERRDGTLLTLRDRAFGHRTTGSATLRTAAEGKTDLLLGFAGFHRDIDEGLADTYLVPGDDPSRLDALVELLLRHGIEVERLEGDANLSTEPHPGFSARSSFPEGTMRVRARQPRGRLAGALLRPDNPLDGSSSYDITAWALPFAYGVEAHEGSGSAGGSWSPVTAVTSPYGAPLATRGGYGYLLPPSVAHAPSLIRFLEDGGRAFAMADTFRLEGVDYPRGTLFFPQGRNENLDQRLVESGLGGVVTAVTTGLSMSGIDLGTNDQAALTLPRVMLMGGEGTASTGFGAHWHFLEQVLDLPFDAVNVGDVGSVDLSRYDVILVPPGNPTGTLGESGMNRLREWVRTGGTLVASGSAARALGRSLADVEDRSSLDEGQPDRDERLARALRTREERAEEQWAERVPGTILKARMDPAHPLTWGAASGGDEEHSLFVLSTGVAFEPSDSAETVAWFPEGVDRISGVISERNLERLDRSSWLMERRQGSGKIILFADDPVFRGFWYGALPLYVNAILLSPRF
jgi:hypothetical protein